MTAEKIEGKSKTKEGEPKEITFRCQSCNQYKPLEEMRVMTRFFPMLIVCQGCGKEMR